MKDLGMRYDSAEIKGMVSDLAQKNSANRVILRPDALHIWEYDKEGNIIKYNVPEDEMTKKGRRVYCYPEHMADENRWICVLYNEENKIAAQGVQVFPR